MALVQTPRKRVSDPREYMTLLLGRHGVGKTTFCAQIPGHYFLLPEIGDEGVEVYGEPVASWEEFVAKVKEIVAARDAGWKDEDGNPVREITTIVIDTIDVLLAYLFDYVCRTQKFLVDGRSATFKRIDEIPWGKGYARVAEILTGTLLKIRHLGFSLFMPCHVKERTVKYAGNDVSKYGPDIPGSVISDALLETCGAVGYFDIEEAYTRKGEEIVTVQQRRLIQWQPTFQKEAKHRLEGFPAVLEVSMHTGWQTYCQAFQDTLARLEQKND